jgi:recombinational DNA repair protein (RecF pathway)
MSHHVYTTPGFVVESHPHKEAGKFIYIFTRDLGMVGAAASGIRFEKSKLRYHAQDFSLATFSLVRGKETWRVVGAQEVLHHRIPTAGDKDAAAHAGYLLYVRILKVLKRLIPGEEKNEALFDAVLVAGNALAGETFTSVELQLIEPLIMLRILHHLGYVRNSADFTDFIKDNSFEKGIVAVLIAPNMKSKIIKEINTALKESQL